MCLYGKIVKQNYIFKKDRCVISDYYYIENMHIYE